MLQLEKKPTSFKKTCRPNQFVKGKTNFSPYHGCHPQRTSKLLMNEIPRRVCALQERSRRKRNETKAKRKRKEEKGRMKRLVFGAIAILLLVNMSVLTFSIQPARAGASTPNMKISIYLSPDVENAALESGEIGINDWPLTKDWASEWTLMPNIINLRDYAEMGMMETDVNHQMWPTGCPVHKFYSQTCVRCVRAVEFRKAVACLFDRDSIVTNVLKGYGYRMDVPLQPFQSAYMDMYNYSQSGCIYNYNRTRAENILNAAGFTMLPSGLRQDPSTPGVALNPIIFYVRQDDPNRKEAGDMLTAELQTEGIQVNAIIAERTVCYKNVVVLYNYNLYTGGWAFDTVPDQYYDLYSSDNYYGPLIGRSPNYPGFCNNGTQFEPGSPDSAGFDYWALKVKYPATINDAIEASKTAGYLFLKYVGSIPMYCTKAIKAYRTGWDDVINNAGYGIDNYWTFLTMKRIGGDTINWGFKNDVEQLNIVTSEWPWDQKVLGLIYESLVGTNPFNLAPTEWFLASAATIGTWNATRVGGDDSSTFINFTLRNDVYWHNKTGNPRRLFTAYDVNFSFYYTYACRYVGVWNYPSLAQWYNCTIYSDTQIAIFYKKKSAWAFQSAGELPMINPDNWALVTPGTPVKTYDPANTDIDGDGVIDLYEDGTGAWIYDDYLASSWVKLKADPLYYLGASYISTRLRGMFWAIAGDVSEDGVVNILDLSYMARSLGASPANPGTGWGQYNPYCDLDSDGNVDLVDLATVTSNYGRTKG